MKSSLRWLCAGIVACLLVINLVFVGCAVICEHIVKFLALIAEKIAYFGGHLK